MVQHGFLCLSVFFGWELYSVSIVYLVWIEGLHSLHSNQSKRKSYRPCTLYSEVQADSIFDQVPEYHLIVSITTLLPFPLSEAISKIQILHSEEYDQKTE